jgi:hypothetical protein
MKANDLRIGNLVNTVLTNEIYAVDLWALSVIKGGNYQNSHDTNTKVFKPIELTKEWLLKFGFKQILERVYIKNYHYGYEFGITNIFIIKNDNCFMRYKHIQYVHQLQNLYFALTNEELSYDTE